jgi:putative DNA primase/helicase
MDTRTDTDRIVTNELRKRLRADGYMPIPVIGKQPPLERWQTKTETNDAEIELWGKLYSNAASTGLLTRMMPTLDIDIKAPAAAQAVEALVRERFEETGKILVRFGNAPKRAIPFKTGAPFKKITANLTAPNGDIEQKLELLADGQQVVAFGIHPDTQRPYDWFGGEPGVIRHDELPA